MSQSTLNVCMYTPTSHGGHALYAHELLASLADVGPGRGVSVELVTWEDLEDALRPAYPVHRILPRLVPREEFHNTAAWAASRVAYYARREHAFLDWVAGRKDIGLIHFQEYTPWLAPRHFRALRRLGIPIVYTVHNIKNHYNKYLLNKTVRDFCFRTSWRDCDALLVHTEGLRDSLSDFLSKGHPPIHVTPHAVWKENVRPARDACGGVGPRDRLLFFGLIRPNKGVDVLLRALELLPRCDLTVVGEPEESHYHEEVRRLARRFPPGRVELIDRYVSEDEMADHFLGCRLVVLPYTSFTAQSGVLHQALAYGRPVVATDVGALGECVRRWGIGQVVPPCDEVSLANGIGRALDPARYDSAVEAIGRVREGLTWEKMAVSTIDVYRSVAR